MKNRKLTIGRISYANLYPIFHHLERACAHREYRFVQGVPSKLNRLLKSGELDISPSSSIEFLRNRNRYLILPWHSISSTGAIRSILLFSLLPVEHLGGKTIALTADSATSTVMLKIILKEFYSLKCRFRTTEQRSVKNILTSASAVLHIGDTAMVEAKKAAVNGSRSGFYIYDLGELWHSFTGLPFVYALWVVRNSALKDKKALVEKFSTDLIRAKKLATKNLRSIAGEAPQSRVLGQQALVDYWKIISYDFTEKHLEGLRLFESYAQALKRNE
jgi:chorismate dehydratase